MIDNVIQKLQLLVRWNWELVDLRKYGLGLDDGHPPCQFCLAFFCFGKVIDNFKFLLLRHEVSPLISKSENCRFLALFLLEYLFYDGLDSQ